MVKNRQEIRRSSVETEKQQTGLGEGVARPGGHRPSGKLAAVTTRNEQRAREAAEAFGADRWFSDPFAMIRDDQVHLASRAAQRGERRESVKLPADLILLNRKY